jgi:RNA polymerase sigma factor (sigma-70 family)
MLNWSAYQACAPVNHQSPRKNLMDTIIGNENIVGYEGLSTADEAHLVQASKNGDRNAFNRLVLNYQDKIYNLALRILGDEDAADDITQNTFLSAYLNLANFRNGSFHSWLWRIATNACYDVYRHKKRHPVQPIDHDDFSEETFALPDEFLASKDLPEAEYEQRELEQVVQQALSNLSMKLRMVVVLVDMQDCDYLEAAQILRIPIGTVKSRLARGRYRLQELLQKWVDVDG